MNNRWVFALCMTILWGIVFIYAMDNVTIGVCMGLLMGMAFGLFDCTKDSEGTDESGSKHEETHVAIVNGKEA